MIWSHPLPRGGGCIFPWIKQVILVFMIIQIQYLIVKTYLQDLINVIRLNLLHLPWQQNYMVILNTHKICWRYIFSASKFDKIIHLRWDLFFVFVFVLFLFVCFFFFLMRQMHEPEVWVNIETRKNWSAFSVTFLEHKLNAQISS